MGDSEKESMDASTLDDIRFLASSSSRISTLESLVESPASKAELRQRLDVPSSSLTRNLSELEDRGWIRENSVEGIYEPTTPGRIVFDAVTEAESRFRNARLATEIDEHVDDSFPMEEEMLRECSIVKATDSEPYRPLERLAEMISRASRMRAIVPILNPAELETLFRGTVPDIDLELIAPPDVVDDLRSHYQNRSSNAPLDAAEIDEQEDLPGYGVGAVDERVFVSVYGNKSTFETLLLADSSSNEWTEWANNVFRSLSEAEAATH